MTSHGTVLLPRPSERETVASVPTSLPQLLRQWRQGCKRLATACSKRAAEPSPGHPWCGTEVLVLAGVCSFGAQRSQIAARTNDAGSRPRSFLRNKFLNCGMQQCRSIRRPDVVLCCSFPRGDTAVRGSLMIAQRFIKSGSDGLKSRITTRRQRSTRRNQTQS